MQWSLLSFGLWDVPVADYLYFYLSLGVVGFLLCYVQRLFVFAAALVLGWLCFSDLRYFYRLAAGPSRLYVGAVILAMLCSLGLIILGAWLNWRKSQRQPAT